ncbi:hypothetical protein B9Q04_14895 [Candidatus Marsarchaeota G2 archaeon BE_D]|uniref:Uncharacterized protein n=1 Tax=Candidatus Marsarchaeota G2 archaeon BE_D TaxID=1978158 RepID=A0A2R6C731_9ARCH|nr:MAG: hypothetical protein B9Q04_14895 [Candidatus Marsarchaeota G2 archaeon BE_D]
MARAALAPLTPTPKGAQRGVSTPGLFITTQHPILYTPKYINLVIINNLIRKQNYRPSTTIPLIKRKYKKK